MAVWSTSGSDCSFALLFAIFAVGTVLALPIEKEEPWWFKPCESKMPKLRHSRSTNDPVKLQFNIFSTRLNNAIREIKQLHGIPPSKKPFKLGKMRWLQLTKMHKKLRKQKENKKTYLKELNRQLQYFAGTLDVLRKANITTTISTFKPDRRKAIYQKITMHLKIYMCEVQESLTGTPPARVTLKDMKIPLEDLRELDNTKAHMIDVAFFTKMQKYFRCLRMLTDPKKKNSRKQHKMCGFMKKSDRT